MYCQTAIVSENQLETELDLARVELAEYLAEGRRSIDNAIQFYQECAVIPSAYQKAAEESVKGIKNEYGLVQ
jgi:hypothetical protein